MTIGNVNIISQDQLVTDSDDDDDDPPILVDLSSSNFAAPSSSAVEQEEHDSSSSLPPPPPCPVTILSGFLGSGKTTLIQYILKSPDHGKRIAVIENEYGEGLAVESLIARDGVGENSSLQDLIELPNGCICCTVKDDLVTTLENLLEKRKDLDYILIEASGMANPGPIASIFWLDDALESRIQLDGIVTLVDSKCILEQLASTEEAVQQIAYADRLIINKVDLLSTENELNILRTELKRIHPTAQTLETSFSKIPNLDWIMNSNCFGGADRLQDLDVVWNERIENEHAHEQNHNDHNHSHHHHHHHDHNESCDICKPRHRHTAGVSTVAFQKKGSVNLSKLNSWLADILWPNQDAEDKVLTAMLKQEVLKKQFHHENNPTFIFRIKGIVSVIGNAQSEDEEMNLDSGIDRRRFIVQGVHDLWEVYPASQDLQWSPSEERIGKLVVIGKHLDEESLRKGFYACFEETL